MSFPATRRSLLARLGGPTAGEERDPAGAAWAAFVADYEAGLLRYVRGRGLQDADARDVVQEVLLAVHAALTDDEEEGRPNFAAAGAFRGWLCRVAFHKSVDALRRRAAARKRGAAAGGTAALAALGELPGDAGSEDEDAADWRRWAYCVAAGRVEAEVAPRTWAAFVAAAVENRPAAAVAAELGLSVGAVYAAKCRTLARLRDVAAGLSEEDAPDDKVVGLGGETVLGESE